MTRPVKVSDVPVEVAEKAIIVCQRVDAGPPVKSDLEVHVEKCYLCDSDVWVASTSPLKARKACTPCVLPDILAGTARIGMTSRPDKKDMH